MRPPATPGGGSAYHGDVIWTAYLRIYLPSTTVVGLPPHRPGDAVAGLTKSSAFIWEESTVDDALYTTWQGTQFVCPRNARLRMVEGVLAYTKIHPGLPLISDGRRLEYVAELASLRRRSRHSRGYILSSGWHVPLRWFSAFKRGEREIYEADGYVSIRYRTSIGEAIDRVHWAIDVLDIAGFSDPVVERVRDLEEWLAEFGADAMVELDYGETAKGFNEADLAFDESADDIRTSLLALESSDYDGSGEAYERVARRWADQQAYTYSN